MGKDTRGSAPSPGHDRHRGNFCGSTPGRNLGFAFINLLTSFLRSLETEPGKLALTCGIGTWSANVVCQTSQSLASQITSQIVGPEINVTFRYNPKEVTRAWGISQVIVDLILGWF
jgi:hypothetical protein